MSELKQDNNESAVEAESESELDSPIFSSESTSSIKEPEEASDLSDAEKKLDEHFMMRDAVVPDYEIFKKPASENGMGDTMVKLRGTVGEIYDSKGALVINIIEHGTENNEYAVLLGEADNDELRKVYEPLQNKEWYLGASYMGFSNVLKLPSVTAWFVACDNEFYDESFDNLISMGMQAEASDYISLSEFNSIEIGMSLKEVQTIVGKSGKLSAESENAFIYEWKGEHGDGVALIHFSDGVVISKSESGLK